MSKSHENMIDVLAELSRYAEINESFVTVTDLHRYMDEYEISKRTVRRCLDSLEDKGFIESKEVGNTTAYVVFDEELLPDAHRLY